MARRRSRAPSGLALVLVMIFLAVAVVLGLSYISVASVRTASSANLLRVTKARYLAESGLDHALYTLLNDPRQFNADNVFGPFAIDDSGDTYVFWAQRDRLTPGRYVVTGQGTSCGVRQRSSAVVFRAAGYQFNVSHSMMIGSGLASLPGSLTVRGDLHTNASLNNSARIFGNVSAKGTIRDPDNLITGEKIEHAPGEKLPDVNCSDYTKYELVGVTYTADKRHTNIFTSDDPLASGGAVGPANIGGVVHIKPLTGDIVTLGPNLDFQGTIVVDGSLLIDGDNIHLRAVSGFPAIVVSDKVYVTDRARATIEGMVVARRGINPYGGPTGNAVVTIEGGLLTTTTGFSGSLDGTHTLDYRAEKCAIYDFGGGKPAPRVVKLLQWLD